MQLLGFVYSCGFDPIHIPDSLECSETESIDISELFRKIAQGEEEDLLKEYFHLDINELKNSYQTQMHSTILNTPLFKEPENIDEIEWAEGDFQKVREYYSLYEESHLDRFLGYVACRMGVIIQGDVNQEQLSNNLDTFDVNKLLMQGPYINNILSISAQQLIYSSLCDVDRVLDVHLHNFGYDEGCYLNPQAASFQKASWMGYFTFMVLRYAAGVSSPIGSTQEARKRIHLYVKHFPKLHGFILPIHQAILPDGKIDWNSTGSYLTNQSAMKTALTFDHPHSQIIPAVTVHPFDTMWQEKLIQAHEQGICLVKWMPPQSIPPDSELLDDYYKLIKQLNMTLIAHSGPEHAIPTNEKNVQWADWGNPLRFRRALQMGVNVILAHSGHKDLVTDLDHPEKIKVPGYQLFFRLAREAHQKNQTEEWTGKVYGDLAAVITHYGPDFIKELLIHSQEEGIRFIYGSDYPFTNLIRPKNDSYEKCAQAGLLSPEKVSMLKEIRAWNPLLANYVFTRNLALKQEGKDIQFPLSTFTGKFKDTELNLVNYEVWNRAKHFIPNIKN